MSSYGMDGRGSTPERRRDISLRWLVKNDQGPTEPRMQWVDHLFPSVLRSTLGECLLQTPL